MHEKKKKKKTLQIADLVAKHASDASSAAVRAGAVIGITKIIENPQSHAVLRELLPNIGNLIHDKSEKVRLAVVRLLWHVKESKAGIKFFHIVPPDHLMARLAAETPTNNAVALSLTSLLLKSYFPQNKKSPTNAEHQPGLPLIIVRTLTFLRNDPDAAAVFYANIAKCLEIDVVTAFIVKLWRCMLNAVHIVLQAPSSSTTRSGKHCDNKRRRHNKDQDNEPAPNPNESRTEQQDDLLNATDSELMANLAETICILWKSVESNLDETGRQFLIDAFSGPENFNLTHILDFFEREQQALVLDDDNEERKNHFHRVKAALLQCAGRLPAQEHLVERFTNKIRSESDENTIVSHLALLCLWDRTGDVANSLAVAIRAGLEDASSCEDSFILSPDYNNGRKRQCKTRNRNLDKSPSHGLIELDSMVALKVLDVVLRGADASSTAAREAIFQCADATSTIEATLSQGQFHAERILADMLPPSVRFQSILLYM
jgi:condensin-2 complex subunit G2